MKRIIACSIAVLLVISCVPMVVNAMAVQDSVFVNGTKLAGAAKPLYHDGHVFVRVEDLAAGLEATVTWNAAKTQARLQSANAELVVTAGRDAAALNGAALTLGAAPVARDGSLLVPLARLGESLGFKAIWDPFAESVFIYRQGGADPREWLEEQSQVLDGADESESPPGGDAFVAAERNKVTIVHQAGIAPQHFYLSDSLPYRIVIDYPAAAFEQAGAALAGSVTAADGGLIDKVRYALFDPATLRVVVELKRHASYTVAASTDGTTVNVLEPVNPYKIVIDAGHGGKDPGATGHSKRFEKHFALELAQKVYALMSKEPALLPLMTRDDDTFVELEDRAAFANDANADLFISIHGNTFESAISGTETYYYSNESLAFGQLMHQYVTEATQLPDRGLRKSPFKVLKFTEMPAVLLEIGYLSTQSDESRMLTADFQDRVAAAIVAGAKAYLLK